MALSKWSTNGSIFVIFTTQDRETIFRALIRELVDLKPYIEKEENLKDIKYVIFNLEKLGLLLKLLEQLEIQLRSKQPGFNRGFDTSFKYE